MTGDDFAEIHDELRAVAADLLGKEHGGAPAWPLLAQAGWTGLEIADELGGAGATFREVAIICEELGRAAATSSYLGSAVLAVAALNSLQPNVLRDELLAGTAAGSARTAVALSADHEQPHAPAPFTLTQSTAGWRLEGRSDFVADANDCERLLVLAHHPDGTPVVVAVRAQATGLTVMERPVLDETRRLALVVADSVDIADAQMWRFVGDPRDAEAAARGLADRAAVAVACDSLGLSEAMLAATVDYAGVRQQFGRPIGSFQAVKHACADMLVGISVSRQLVTAAVSAISNGGPDTAQTTARAKAYACQTAVEVAGKAMQLHGGIGYTWESGIHVYLKRATLNRSLFGSPTAHRRRLVI